MRNRDIRFLPGAEFIRLHRSSGRLGECRRHGEALGITDETGLPAFFAGGYGGQYVYVLPDLDLVAVTTGDAAVAPDKLMDYRHVIRDFLVPAVKDRPAARGGTG